MTKLLIVAPFAAVLLATLQACSESASDAEDHDGTGGVAGTGGTPALGGTMSGGSSNTSGQGGAASAPQAGAGGDAGARSTPTMCADPQQVYAFTAGPTPDGASFDEQVDLAACLYDAGAQIVVRVDRTGASLCTAGSPLAPCPFEGCSHECAANGDCGNEQACLCPSAVPLGSAEQPWAGVYAWASTCIESTCESSADCGGFACGYSREKCDVVPPGFYCRTPQDECDSDADCTGALCRFFADRARWACSTITSCEG